MHTPHAHVECQILRSNDKACSASTGTKYNPISAPIDKLALPCEVRVKCVYLASSEIKDDRVAGRTATYTNVSTLYIVGTILVRRPW